MKYSFIAQHKKTWPVDPMCQLLGVSRNGFYRYQNKHLDNRNDPEHQKMLRLIKAIAADSNYSYGARRIKKSMSEHGYRFGYYKARKLMKEAGIQVRHRKKYKITTNSNHKQPVFDNVLNRQFSVSQPNQVYASDITCVWTQEGWLYLAVVIDLFSRRIVGWSMSSRMKAKLVCDALKMAIWQRQPAPGLIAHSDRGSQYASHAYRQLLEKNDFIGSMSRKGNCWDNSVVESFFGSLKRERVQWRHYQTRYEAQQDILNYISMFYNSHRLHSYLDYRSPIQFEAHMAKLKKVA